MIRVVKNVFLFQMLSSITLKKCLLWLSQLRALLLVRIFGLIRRFDFELINSINFFLFFYQDNVEYLQKCADPEVQYGAVATGGIIGMLFGIRKSFVRRIFYGAIGAGAMFSVVFPEDAARISREGYDLAMKYGKEGYDYFAGSKYSYTLMLL